MSSLKVIVLAVLLSGGAWAQQNAGPLNAAPGVPNQNPTEPNVASKTRATSKSSREKPINSAIQACENLQKGSACEMSGVNSAKLKGSCQANGLEDGPLICKVK